MGSKLLSNEIGQPINISNIYSLNKYDNENQLMGLSKEPGKRLLAIQRSQDVLKTLRNKAITKVIRPQILTKCLSSNTAISNKNIICVKNIRSSSILKALSKCEEVKIQSFDSASELAIVKCNNTDLPPPLPIEEIIVQEDGHHANADNSSENAGTQLKFKDIVLQHKEVDQLPSDKNKTIKEMQTSEAVVTRVLASLGISAGDLFSIKTTQGSRFWICPIKECDHLSPRLFHLKTHILEHYRCKPFKCDFEECDWAFYTAVKLKRHKEIHSGNKDFPCDEVGCLKRFTTIYNLRLHRKLHERPKIHSCTVPECEEVFRTKRELETHLKVHDPVYAPYKCPVESCGNSYFSHSALISHSRSHQYKLNELQCQWENCGKMFDQPCRLKEHMRQHTGDKPYKCQYENCTSSFVSSSKLRRHERSHINDRKYTCIHENCNKSFFRKEHLKQHIAMRHEQNFVTCPETDCGLVFLSKSCLNRHVSNMHSGQKKPKKRKPKSEIESINEDSPEIATKNECNDMTLELNNTDPSTLCEATMNNEVIENTEQAATSTSNMWINFDELDYSSQNVQSQSNNMIEFSLSDITGPSGIISEELKNLINECTMQTQSEFSMTENSTGVNDAITADYANAENYEEYNEPNVSENIDLSEINKFYNGITLENGISVKLGNLSENLDQNVEHCTNNETVPNELINTSIPLDIEHLRELIAAGNCTLQVNEEGNVVTILENETVVNTILPIATECLQHDENNILETVKKKKIENGNENENLDSCARTFFTYQQFCEDRSAKLNKLQYTEIQEEQNGGISDNALISEQSEIVNKNSVDNSDISYDVDDFEISEQYMSLINQGASSVYEIQEVNNGMDIDQSKLRLQTYPTTEDKLSALCDETDIDNLNWVNKSLNDSNDAFNFEIKREHISANSFMQYELIESFGDKHEQSSLHGEMGELLAIDNLDPHFYETGDTSFTANNIRNIKDTI